MKDFFSTLFKWNLPNIGKAILGGATGVLSYPAVIAAVPILSPPVALGLAIIIGIGTALGVHGYAITPPPKTPDQIGPK